MPGHGQRLLVPNTEENRVTPCCVFAGVGTGGTGGGAVAAVAGAAGTGDGEGAGCDIPGRS